MIDFDKFAKCSKPGPRYTSYPTAVEFSEKFNPEIYKKALNKNSNLPLSIYLHLPFCKSACYFCGCNVIYTNKEDKKQNYIKYLEKEINILKNYINTNSPVLQLHFGGGTPTFYDAKSLERIISLIKNTFNNFDVDAENSCEIDPRHFNEDHMKVLSEYGFNRLSFGVQDFNEKVQISINRNQPFSMVENATNIARKYGVNNINFDLIYGLPEQNLQTFKETLNKVLKLEPTRLAIFNYAHVPWIKKTMRKIDEYRLPQPKEKLLILEYIIKHLLDNKYKMIGMDHFALENDELYQAYKKGKLKRNFQGYTAKKYAQTIGIGLTSIGEGEDYYVQNHKDYDAYVRALESNELPICKGIKLDYDDLIRKNVIMKLMNNLTLDIKRIEHKFNIDFKTYFKESIKKLDEYIDLNLVSIDSNYIKISPNGVMLVRNIVMAFDKYIDTKIAGENKFSKTI